MAPPASNRQSAIFPQELETLPGICARGPSQPIVSISPVCIKPRMSINIRFTLRVFPHPSLPPLSYPLGFELWNRSSWLKIPQLSVPSLFLFVFDCPFRSSLSLFYKMKSVLALAASLTSVAATANLSSSCYVLPSDTDWPSTSTWDSLNTTVNGHLVATVPIGSPCHDPNYDAAACAVLQNNWTVASTQYVSLSQSSPSTTCAMLIHLLVTPHPRRSCKSSGPITAAIHSPTSLHPARLATMSATRSMSLVLTISYPH